ncbi:uncharacterized protein L969DRAFT_87340 [Mixia osmundae IAM 14324]|uniref:ER membrane protein complex subunit 3 n=1 Tax=Mixia osmundae (strain CBS 9802 / IAM 14324 / JCM 22182 / KY 12970) TaxID=764103 RepID=G7E3I5_MIXOS|nr:uncharacterized protein L969DRAFT_87340 [Mixia osmundae IAM 14324]KEI39381.1 hypothetical protein L969DRAFT_87340 [Mixia osmundae IAM 14324]GAA97395.1 hypothetical protein E5Q_04073 [Mixia osmundae IAM 14324]
MSGRTQQLYLDPDIRNWVLIPITIVMLLVGLLRHYVVSLLNSPPKPLPLKALREQRLLTRSNLLRTYANQLSPAAFQARKEALGQALESGDYLKAPPNPDGASAPPNPLSDPAMMEGMMGGLKKQMVMMVPQTVIMAWINFFFNGFVLIRLPFPLTIRFKSMLQRGIDTQDMDVTWVSSLSWYFLNLFGLNSVYQLILGEENAADGTRDMQAMGAMGGGMMGGMPGAPAQDFVKLFAAERENLDLVDHVWIGNDVEQRLLAMYGMQ